MKKIIILLPLLLTGCAAGINHNVANINGHTYLVETKTNNFLGFSQWSEKSTFTDLENMDIPKEIVNAHINQVKQSCNSRFANGKGYSYEKVYKCMLDTLGIEEQ